MKDLMMLVLLAMIPTAKSFRYCPDWGFESDAEYLDVLEDGLWQYDSSFGISANFATAAQILKDFPHETEIVNEWINCPSTIEEFKKEYLNLFTSQN